MVSKKKSTTFPWNDGDYVMVAEGVEKAGMVGKVTKVRACYTFVVMSDGTSTRKKHDNLTASTKEAFDIASGAYNAGVISGGNYNATVVNKENDDTAVATVALVEKQPDGSTAFSTSAAFLNQVASVVEDPNVNKSTDIHVMLPDGFLTQTNKISVVISLGMAMEKVCGPNTVARAKLFGKTASSGTLYAHQVLPGWQVVKFRMTNVMEATKVFHYYSSNEWVVTVGDKTATCTVSFAEKSAKFDGVEPRKTNSYSSRWNNKSSFDTRRYTSQYSSALPHGKSLADRVDQSFANRANKPFGASRFANLK